MSDEYYELRVAYNDETIPVFTADEWFHRLDNGDNCTGEVARLVWERDNARATIAERDAEIDNLKTSVRNLISNIEGSWNLQIACLPMSAEDIVHELMKLVKP